MAGTSDQSSIKSKAVVKFEAYHLPDTFTKLEPQTDLHQAPEDWLVDSEDGHSVTSRYSTSNPVGHCPENLVRPDNSFEMASQHLDMVGDVDIIASADVVKKLIRLPFDKRQLSIVVHRISKTLLLDEFDILALLIASEESEWQWIRDFVQNNILEDLKQKNTHIKKPYGKSTPAAMERAMVSKFLHYSMPKMLGSHEVFNQDNVITPPESNEMLNLPEPPSLVEPHETCQITGPTRNVLWEFENMQMLLGSNLPIFGGANHPVVSLRLHDASKPINVLTGLDYWLDNLICNVPELAMCYHINGIVQKYEIYKTMDIPHLESSQFSATAVRDIAQNILSFLNNNCAKEGHTYWLFKPHGDEIVKLYDLTSICETAATNSTESSESASSDNDMQNPFAIPVAFLLYRVAKNLVAKFSEDSQRSSKMRATVYSLLKNALKLIRDIPLQTNCTPSSSSSHSSSSAGADDGKQKLSSQCKDLEACIYFLLVQLYVPSGKWHDWASGKKRTISHPGEYDDIGSESGESLNNENDAANDTSNDNESFLTGVSMETSNLFKTEKSLLKEHKKAHEISRLDLTVEERCRAALDYTLQCFQFLQQFATTSPPSQQSSSESNTSAVSLKTSKSWHELVECSLFYKLAVMLSTLALQFFDMGKYGRSFRYLKLALGSYCSIKTNLIGDTMKHNKQESLHKFSDIDFTAGAYLIGKILQLLGDVFMLFSSCLSSSDEANLHLEEATQGHTTVEFQLSCFLMPQNNSELYEKLERLNLSLESSVCLESAKTLYLMCEEHMKKLSLSDSNLEKSLQSSSKLSVTSSTNNKCASNQSRASKKPKGNSKSNSGPNSKTQKSAEKKEGENSPLTISDYSFSGGEALLKRLGNVNNELGKMFENRLIDVGIVRLNEKDSMANAEEILDKSKSCFNEALQCFVKSNDKINAGMVLSNNGRLFRIWAHLLALHGAKSDCIENTENDSKCTDRDRLNGSGDRQQDTPKKHGVSPTEKSFYYKSIDCYRQAVSYLETSDNPKLLDSVTWDLCSTYFTLGKNLQDFFDASTLDCIEEMKQEIISLFNKSLKHCVPPERHHSSHDGTISAEEIDFLREKYLNRLGEIHQRLGSLYYHSFRFDPLANKSSYAMAEMHYSKAAECCILQVAKNPNVTKPPRNRHDVKPGNEQNAYVYKPEHDAMLAQVQLERVALVEVQITATQNAKLVPKLYRSCFVFICEAFDALERIGFETQSLSDIFIAQTRKVLLASCKAFTSQPAGKGQKSDHSSTTDAVPQLKAIYAKTLKIDGKNAAEWQAICKDLKAFVKSVGS